MLERFIPKTPPTNVLLPEALEIRLAYESFHQKWKIMCACFLSRPILPIQTPILYRLSQMLRFDIFRAC
jgi:hypothetical protein